MTDSEKEKLSKNGLSCSLPDDRHIAAFPQEDGTIVFEFKNKGTRTTLKLSSEAIEVVTYLYFQLRNNGYAA